MQDAVFHPKHLISQVRHILRYKLLELKRKEESATLQRAKAKTAPGPTTLGGPPAAPAATAALYSLAALPQDYLSAHGCELDISLAGHTDLATFVSSTAADVAEVVAGPDGQVMLRLADTFLAEASQPFLGLHRGTR